MLEIFFVFLRVGLLSFGGGNAAMPYIESEVVDKKKWIKREEFYELIAVTNSLPGPNMTQVCSFICYKQKKIPGIIVGVCAMLLPPALLFTFVMVMFKDSIDPVIMNKIATGAIWFIVALMFNLILKIFKSAIVTKPNMILFALLGGIALTGLIIGLTTAIVISGSLLLIVIGSLVFRETAKKIDNIDIGKKLTGDD